MSDPAQRANEIDPKESWLTPIWIAFLVSILLYAGLAWFVAPGRTVQVDDEIEMWMLVFLAMSSGLHVLTVLLLRQAIAAVSGGRYVNYCIFRWSLIEGIAIYGILLAFFGVGMGVTSIFFAASALVMAGARPGFADRAAFVAQFR